MNIKIKIALVGIGFLPFFESRIYDSQKIFDYSLSSISVLKKESDICLWVMSLGKLSLVSVIQFQQWRYMTVLWMWQSECCE